MQSQYFKPCLGVVYYTCTTQFIPVLLLHAPVHENVKEFKGKGRGWKLPDHVFQTCSSFKCLGVIVTETDDISADMKARISAGNKWLYAVQKILWFRRLTRNLKINIYKTTTRPVVSYGNETWTVMTSAAPTGIHPLWQWNLIAELKGRHGTSWPCPTPFLDESWSIW